MLPPSIDLSILSIRFRLYFRDEFSVVPKLSILSIRFKRAVIDVNELRVLKNIFQFYRLDSG